MAATTTHYRTIARLVVDFQVPFHRLRQLIDAQNIAPSMVINGVGHFDGNAVDKIHAALVRNKLVRDGADEERGEQRRSFRNAIVTKGSK
ncbi:MAG TPA: hypothetical protein VH475_08270 [Tepidisphaeraceae bacterium]|jgi:hypothetical protein